MLYDVEHFYMAEGEGCGLRPFTLNHARCRHLRVISLHRTLHFVVQVQTPL